MKKYAGIAATLALLASPAWALKITNLDNVAHRVEFVAAGTAKVETLAPDETVILTGLQNGTLSLLSANPPKPSTGTLHADGLLSGIVGAARDQQIPTDVGDEYVIWPGGKLLLQRKRPNGSENGPM